MGRSLIECFFTVYKTPSSCFPSILYCVKMRKVESINFRFGGRSTTFCSSVYRMESIFYFVNPFKKTKGSISFFQHLVSPTLIFLTSRYSKMTYSLTFERKFISLFLNLVFGLLCPPPFHEKVVLWNRCIPSLYTDVRNI